MRVLFYGACPAAPINEYNAAELIRHHPEHEYRSVTVEKRPRTRSTLGRIRRAIPFGAGRYAIERDREEVDAYVRGITNDRVLERMEDTRVNGVNDLDSERAIRAFEPDVIIQSGAGILKPNIFDLARLGTLNVHHGYAPELRGMQSTQWALYYGLHRLLGVTVHLIDEGIDTGVVVRQERHPYQPGETFVNIQTRLVEKGAELLREALGLLAGEHTVQATTVTSYYFSAFSKQKYARLKRRGFRPVESTAGIRTKQKQKRVLRATVSP